MLEYLAQAAQNAAPAAPNTLDSVDKLVKIIAVILGGIWTYLNYVRGRTFKRRLELKISGKIVAAGDSGPYMVSGTAQVKNVGLSKVDIERSGTGGWPSIRAKALSRTKNPWRCVSIAIPAREVDDENSGKHLLHL